MSETIQIRRFHIDLPPVAAARMERLKAETDATSYNEVVRHALLEYEAVLAERARAVNPK